AAWRPVHACPLRGEAPGRAVPVLERQRVARVRRAGAARHELQAPGDGRTRGEIHRVALDGGVDVVDDVERVAALVRVDRRGPDVGAPGGPDGRIGAAELDVVVERG